MEMSLGARGESLAVDFLKRQGYSIVQQNYRVPFGEIDIVAKDKDAVCFVEVKTRESLSCGSGLEAISRAKQRRIIRTAAWYLQEKGWEDCKVQFDVVAIAIYEDGGPVIDFVQHAFEA
ncbi:MAG: YraN family protein [Candidatus Omnitrophica bacterium]|nr:YraN family protein [Candidatus Omnitrophota bacterium]